MDIKSIIALLIISSLCLNCGGGGGKSNGQASSSEFSSSSSSIPHIFTHLEVIDGNNQTAHVGTAISIILVVLDPAQKPVAYTEVIVKLQQDNNSIGQPGGNVASTKLISDSEGKVTINWTLGTRPGGYTIIASTIDIAGLQLSANGIAGPIAKLEKTYGDSQIGLSGSTLYSTGVKALDQYNNAISNIEISCEVIEGGGSVAIPPSQASLKTDAFGNAFCGQWTLGSNEGRNTLKVSSGSISTEFYATAADIIINLPMSIVNDPADVFAKIQSKHQLTSVEASIGNNAVQLTSDYEGWKGQLPLTSYARGQLDFDVIAHDILGHSKTAKANVTLNRKPVLAINSPVSGSVVDLKDVLVSVSCTDDDQSNLPKITVDDRDEYGTNSSLRKIYATGTGNISTHISLSANEGEKTNLRFICVDSDNQATILSTELYVDSSKGFTIIDTISSGQVLDADSSHVLYVENSTTLKIKDLTNGTVNDINTKQKPSYIFGYLAPGGAIYTLAEPAFKSFDWNGTTNLDLGTSTIVEKNGDFVVYTQPDGNNLNLILRNLNTQTNSTLVTSLQQPYQGYLASNGDFSYYDSATSKVGFLSFGNSVIWTDYSSKPIYKFIWSDGKNFLYERALNSLRSLIYDDGTIETTLMSYDFSLYPNITYDINNGYIAFTKLTQGNLLQVFRRNLDGSIEQLSLFGNRNSTVEAIDADGTVFIKSYDVTESIYLSTGKRYKVAQGKAIEEIGSGIGKIIFRNNKALILIGGNILEVK